MTAAYSLFLEGVHDLKKYAIGFKLKLTGIITCYIQRQRRKNKIVKKLMIGDNRRIKF